MRKTGCLSIAIGVFALIGCNPPGKDDGVVHPPDSLRVEPADAILTIESGMSAALDYRAIYTDEDGRDVDVTGEAEFHIENVVLGSFERARFTSNTQWGGRTTVRADARGASGDTSLTIRMHSVVILPGAPEDAADKFGGGEDTSRAPSLVYPAPGVLVPPNLSELEVHFRPGPGNTLFDLRFQGVATDLEIFMPCTPLGDGCLYAFDETVWALLAEAERGAPEPVTVSLRGVDGANPGSVGVAATQEMSFGQEDIVGGIYYWNAGAGAIRRYDFGRRGQSAENFLDRTSVGASTCVGCHVLSRDGTRIVVGMDIPAPAPYKVIDVVSRAMIYGQGSTFGGGANFFSFSPDATQIMTSNGLSIAWRDANSGAAIEETLVPSGTMPDWSPDGSRLVYSRPGTAPPCIGGICGAPGVDSGQLELLRYDGAAWGAPEVLVEFGGQNNYYPAFSPDGEWVMFNRSPGNQNSFDSPDAQVWTVTATGGQPIYLATASSGGDSWPKWAPNVQTWRSGSLLWFTFSSRRAYGLRTEAGAQAQIWMAGFSPAKAAAGEDGSMPGFWLPFQELDSGNHIAQWVSDVERPPCFEDSNCPNGELCEGGLCVGNDVD